MRYPFVGKIIVADQSFPIVGHVVDGPRRSKLGHAVIEAEGATAAICKAIGSGEPIKIQETPNEPREIDVNVIEFDNSTLRFTIK